MILLSYFSFLLITFKEQICYVKETWGVGGATVEKSEEIFMRKHVWIFTSGLFDTVRQQVGNRWFVGSVALTLLVIFSFAFFFEQLCCKQTRNGALCVPAASIVRLEFRDRCRLQVTGLTFILFMYKRGSLISQLPHTTEHFRLNAFILHLFFQETTSVYLLLILEWHFCKLHLLLCLSCLLLCKNKRWTSLTVCHLLLWFCSVESC